MSEPTGAYAFCGATCRCIPGAVPGVKANAVPMKDAKIKQHEMTGAVSRFILDHATEIAAVPAATDEAADVSAAYARTNKALANPVVQTQDVTEKATKAQKLLRDALPALLGPLASVATKANDITLLAKATLRARQLARLSPTELNELADQLIGLGEAQPAAVQTRYALSAILPILRGYQTDFAPLVGQTQDLIDDRSGAGQSAKTCSAPPCSKSMNSIR